MIKKVKVSSFKVFLEKAKDAKAKIYHMHRKLGSVFIDLSLEKDSIIFVHRIDVSLAPMMIESELKWEDNLPYELETYQIKGEQVKVKLYRDLEKNRQSLLMFLEDVAMAIDEVSIPQGMQDKIYTIKRFVERLSRFKNTSDDDDENFFDVNLKKAITSEIIFDLWNFDEDELFVNIFTEYLFNYIKENKKLYVKNQKKAQEERSRKFSEIEKKVVSLHKIEEYGFKRGYITN